LLTGSVAEVRSPVPLRSLSFGNAPKESFGAADKPFSTD
jgi:hypothetical protein